MRKIHDLGVYYQSPRLKCCGDSVIVDVFVLLELIIRELYGSLGSTRTRFYAVDLTDVDVEKIVKALFKVQSTDSRLMRQ
jgi:hypothetical protein